jgi:hypothetical protein
MESGFKISCSDPDFWATNFPDRNLALATKSPSAVALPIDADPFGATLVSITYGFSPRSPAQR